MNLLLEIKLKNKYDYITESLYKEDEEGELIPITDIEGSTAILLTDGTSWQFADDEWVQIEQDLDTKILNSLYPFISSVCESINNSFVKYELTQCFKDVVFSYKENTNKKVVVVSNLDKKPFAIGGDFIRIITPTNVYFTRVLANNETNMEIDNVGVNIRITGEEEIMALQFISFPQSFINTVLEMLSYDMFLREAKELRQERLGNYTYTNFESDVYYGDNAYPKKLVQSIKYWERIFV